MVILGRFFFCCVGWLLGLSFVCFRFLGTWPQHSWILASISHVPNPKTPFLLILVKFVKFLELSFSWLSSMLLRCYEVWEICLGVAIKWIPTSTLKTPFSRKLWNPNLSEKIQDCRQSFEILDKILLVYHKYDLGKVCAKLQIFCWSFVRILAFSILFWMLFSRLSQNFWPYLGTSNLEPPTLTYAI